MYYEFKTYYICSPYFNVTDTTDTFCQLCGIYGINGLELGVYKDRTYQAN